jgi:hypothetical protein
MGLAGGYRGNGKRRNGRLAFRRDRLLPAERRRLSGFVGFCGCCGCYRQAQSIPHAKFQFLLSACAIREPPFLCCERHRRSFAASKWLSWSLCRKEWFLSQCGRSEFIFAASGSSVNRQERGRWATSRLDSSQTACSDSVAESLYESVRQSAIHGSSLLKMGLQRLRLLRSMQDGLRFVSDEHFALAKVSESACIRLM